MLWFVILATFLQRSIAGPNITDTLQGLLSGYDHRIRPDHEGPPTTVSLLVYVESLGPLQELTMDFSSSFYLGMDWIDTRLMYTGERYITIKGDDINRFWLPDIFFLYEKEGHHHNIIQANQMLKILPNGTCRYVVRVSLTAVCRMALHRFPFDTQTCTINMMSFAYSNEELLLTIRDDAVVVGENALVAEYDFKGLSTGTFIFGIADELPGAEMYINETLEGVEVKFTFKRQLQTYILTVYIPSLLLVIISWMSFWIDAHAAPARITLGITTVMTANTMTASMQESFPNAKEAKAIDIWLAACLIFVFLSLIEYALTNYLIVLHERKMKCCETTKTTQDARRPMSMISRNNLGTDYGINRLPANSTKDCSLPELENTTPKVDFSAEQMDKLARIVFALAFIAFNICYWTIYVVFEP
ncbi:glycine receptor subunit alpha-2-like [Amphiura filiformis]|uniref:glycine receptor subunit alpha-2-like n=1 Tax=Amphiura filiformis TaxID=82378 RepID=UPI003B222BE4